MRHYEVWISVVLLGAMFTLARAADQELQPGPYDKNIEIKRPVQPTGAQALAATEVPSADEVLVQAKAKALAQDKAIFLHFGASWCGWCRKLDAFLEQPDIKPVFERYFVPVKLGVQENEKNKSLENAGADAVLRKFGGPSGLPYFAFLDAHGSLIINSKHDGQNIGYPGEPTEIDWFMQMIRKAAPKVSEPDVKVIETALRHDKKA